MAGWDGVDRKGGEGEGLRGDRGGRGREGGRVGRWGGHTPDTHMRCTIVLGAGGRATATQQPISSV